MSQFIDHLKAEHKQILGLLQSIMDSWGKPKLLEQILELEEILKAHHFLEEQHLFKAMYETKKVNEGGPNCTFFYGMYLNTLPYLQSLLKEGNFNPENEKEPIQGILINKSALAIPIEEHRACHVLLEKIKKNLPHEENKARLNFEKYQSILREHIRKEDECLFQMAEILLSEDCKKNLNLL